jgi:hypothetical protein
MPDDTNHDEELELLLAHGDTGQDTPDDVDPVEEVTYGGDGE